MINTGKFVSLLTKNKINFYCGVPDSCLKFFLNYVAKKRKKHVIAPNEGSAVSIGIGYYLKTKKLPLVYLQNSGLGNATDPLTSLCSKEAYSIPMMLLVGWRGSPRIKDEPQHALMGRITPKLLKLLEIKFTILRKDNDLKKIPSLVKYSQKIKKPVALIVEPNILSKVVLSKKDNVFLDRERRKFSSNLIFRPDAIKCILKSLKRKTNIISATGFTSRELHQIKKQENIKMCKDFLMIGGMGHTATTTLGTMLFNKKKDTICLDGDGSFLMHMGGVASAVAYSNNNLKYVLFDNNAHESVGPTNQPTISGKINFKKMSEGFGFQKFFSLDNDKNYKKKLTKYIRAKGSVFILIKIKAGSLSSLERPEDMKKIKNNFMY